MAKLGAWVDDDRCPDEEIVAYLDVWSLAMAQCTSKGWILGGRNALEAKVAALVTDAPPPGYGALLRARPLEALDLARRAQAFRQFCPEFREALPVTASRRQETRFVVINESDAPIHVRWISHGQVVHRVGDRVVPCVSSNTVTTRFYDVNSGQPVAGYFHHHTTVGHAFIIEYGEKRAYYHVRQRHHVVGSNLLRCHALRVSSSNGIDEILCYEYRPPRNLPLLEQRHRHVFFLFPDIDNIPSPPGVVCSYKDLYFLSQQRSGAVHGLLMDLLESFLRCS